MRKGVLIVDDNPSYRNAIIRAFMGEDYVFFEASSVQEGIRILNDNQEIRVILLDLLFSGGEGTLLLKQLKDRASLYRVIILTAHGALLSASEAVKFDIFCYLAKSSEFSAQSIHFAVEQAFKDIGRALLLRKIHRHLEIQKKINSNYELNEVLDLICESILEITEGYTCHIRLFDLKTGDYVLASFRGPSNMSNAFSPPKRLGEYFSGVVANTGRPVIISDLQSHELFKELKEQALKDTITEELKDYYDRIKSAYIIPISTGVYETEVDAVLNVTSEISEYFSDEEKRNLVDEFAAQSAIAITKVWQINRRKEIHRDYNKISGMLADISHEFRGSDRLSKIFEVAVTRISEIINPEIISIFLFNNGTGLLENVAEYRGAAFIQASEEVYAPGVGLAGDVFTNSHSIRISGSRNSRHINNGTAERYEPRRGEEQLTDIPSGRLEHYLGVPMMIGYKVLGVIRVINKKSDYYRLKEYEGDSAYLLARGFSEDDETVLRITANQLAVSIQNAQLIDKLDRKVKQLQILNSEVKMIGSEINIGDLLQLTIEQTAEIMQSEICMLFLKDENSNSVVLSQCFGMPLINGAFYALGEGLTGKVAATGESVLVTNAVAHWGKYDKHILKSINKNEGDRRAIESFIAVPVVAKGKILGVIKVINKLDGSYDEEDLNYLEIFASYVGIAIENAQLYDLANQKLAIAERNSTLSLLVRSVAHEINNTFGLVPANIQLIKESLPMLDKEIRGSLDIIEDSALQALSFANELAGFSASKLSKLELLDINKLIDKAITVIETDFQKQKSFQHISVRRLLSTNPIYCRVYENPFIQIIRNIIINAYHAMENKESGVLTIETELIPTLQTARIEFTDTGCGIKQENIEHLFAADFTTKEGGNGLGLWLVKNHLDRIGATISVHSILNEGTTFVVEIPAVGH